MNQHQINLPVRYHRWHTDPGEHWSEETTGPRVLQWGIPLAQTALVLIDVWNSHYLHSCNTRVADITVKKVIPFLNRSRAHGLRIIHAPSNPLARQNPWWIRMIDDSEMKEFCELGDDSWPPAAFRARTGEYSRWAYPVEPREKELDTLREKRTFFPGAEPSGNDAVIANGLELHRYCRKENILFLLFCGFNANACVQLRDYGIPAMRTRGYCCILLRDCTTGMESPQTLADLALTNAAVSGFEMFGSYSADSAEIEFTG